MTVRRYNLSMKPTARFAMGRGNAVMQRMVLILGVLAAAGCFSFNPKPLTEEQKMNSSAGVEREQAVVDAGLRQDRARIPTLINRLEDDDVAVRLAAINSLRSMTGKDFGYVAYDDEMTRRAAVTRWREWWRKEGGGKP